MGLFWGKVDVRANSGGSRPGLGRSRRKSREVGPTLAEVSRLGPRLVPISVKSGPNSAHSGPPLFDFSASILSRCLPKSGQTWLNSAKFESCPSLDRVRVSCSFQAGPHACAEFGRPCPTIARIRKSLGESAQICARLQPAPDTKVPDQIGHRRSLAASLGLWLYWHAAQAKNGSHPFALWFRRQLARLLVTLFYLIQIDRALGGRIGDREAAGRLCICCRAADGAFTGRSSCRSDDFLFKTGYGIEDAPPAASEDVERLLVPATKCDGQKNRPLQHRCLRGPTQCGCALSNGKV